MKIYKIAQVGVGRWGQNYVKAIKNFSNIELVAICRLQNIRPDFIPDTCKVYTNKISRSESEQISHSLRGGWMEMVKEHSLDGIIIVIPEPWIHTSKYLDLNIPILCEKPASTAVGLDFFTKKSTYKKFMVNYIHLFSDPFQELKKIVGDNKIIRMCTSGFGPSKTREHFSPLWDYGPHDLSMILSLVGAEPTEVDIQTHNKSKAGHSFRMNLRFGDVKTKSIVGNGTIVKSRYFSVTFEKDGKENCITYDDMRADELFLNGKPIPYPKTASPLENSIASFLELIDGNNDPRHGVELTTRITKILSTYED